ncbi:MAG: isoaspartyl peptidase/L-asparaginase family protein [Mariniblastus sp.]
MKISNLVLGFFVAICGSQLAICQDSNESNLANEDAKVVHTEGAATLSSKKEFAIAIHGGAGSSAANFDEQSVKRRKASMEAALKKGVEILSDGGSSLDAVETVIQYLENDPQFNAGKGAVFNAVGSHELDASIMDGSNKACGAVAGVSHIKNPISLARLVMTETRHVLLAGEGAEEFGKQQNVEWVEPGYFDTESARRSWERYKRRAEQKKLKKTGAIEFDPAWQIGTVGCVALDKAGNLAAGTSTGGMTYKKFGRVGDSPVVGAGTYADNETCAVSSTGTGEEYIRNAIAYDVSAQLKYRNVTLRAAVDDNLNNRLRKGDGGLIAVDRMGNIAMGFNTGGMARASADSTGKFEVIWGEKAGE